MNVEISGILLAMLSEQVSATKMSSPVSRSTTDLDRLGQAAYQLGLGYLWKGFESKIPDLFVDDATESKVGVVTVERDQVHPVSTPEELCTILGKGVPTLLYEPLRHLVKLLYSLLIGASLESSTATTHGVG